LGRGKLGMTVLQGLLSKPHVRVVAIFNCAPTPEVLYTADDFRRIALDKGIPFYFTNQINQQKYQQVLSNLDIDLTVAMLWLFTIGQSIIDTAKIGFINCHSGMLPAYRGNACTNWAILNGEKEVGFTTHFMKGGELDNGPVLLQEKIQINDKTTIRQLVDSFDEVGARLTLQTVDAICEGNIHPVVQSEREALYCYPRLPRDGEIDWNLSCKEIEKLIRAAGDPYPGAYSFFADARDANKIKKMVVHKARIEDHPIPFCAVKGHLIKLDNGNKWGVVCGDKKLLILEDISIDNLRTVPQKFFKTIRQRFGVDTETLLRNLNLLKAE